MQRIFSLHGLVALCVAIASGVAISAIIKLDRTARAGAGYKAKIACSEAFVAGRDPAKIIAGEFNDIDASMKHVGVRIITDRDMATASAYGFGRVNAVYREGYGCSLASGGRVAPLPERTIDAPSAETNAAIKTNDEIRAIVDAAIINNPSNHRAIVVMHDGEIISEGYAEGFSDKTPLLGWSMSKSVIGTLVGAAVEAGFLSLDDPIGAPEWPGGDDRSALTWRHLLQMQSGLAFDEDYRNLRSDAVRMLFEQADAGAYAVRQPAAAPPNAMFNYSSGTTNILARALNDLLKENDTDIYAFATNRIFRPIGASSFVMEPDAAGNPVGSSFIYATARDWARLGQLYLQDGVWADKPILPSGWTTFTQDPASESDGQYGGQVWLNRDGAFERERDFPSLPESAYYFSGHEGQFVLIMPSNNMVIARLGMTRRGSAEPAVDALAAEIISTLY